MPSQDSLNFQCAAITGGAGGLGKAMAEYFISKGKKVLLVGRTESNLQTTTKEIGAAGYYVLDTGKTADIPAFVKQITSDHPELDCLVNNAGVQRPIHVLRDDDFLQKADQEIDINIRGPMHLVLNLLPHLKTKPNPLIINISSVLGFLPFSIINPVYNGTKAWLHAWSVNIRTQLKNQGSKVRVVEIAPPMVESDLHRERENPDDNKKSHSSIALSTKEFIDEISTKLERGDEMITAGPGNGIVDRWYETFGEDYKKAESGFEK